MKSTIRRENNKGIAPMVTIIIIVVIILVLAIAISAFLMIQSNKKKADKQLQEQIEANRLLEEQQKQNKIEETKQSNIDEETGWDLDKVTKVISNDNIRVPVPKGYTASSIEGEKNVLTGFVIKEGTDGSKTSGVNEFVWIPIFSMDEIYDSTNNMGQLWDFGTPASPNNPCTKRAYSSVQNNGYREPDVVTNAMSGENSANGKDCDSAVSFLVEAGLSLESNANDFKTQLQKEFADMIASIKKYKGFYIGRYETGNLSLLQGNKAVVQKYNTDISSKDWYTQYKLSKTIAANSNVTTSMIWGCKWDITLKWMQRYGSEDVRNFTTDSKLHGNFKDTELKYKVNSTSAEQTKAAGVQNIIPTGSSETTKVNNIYDMAGNVTDWTLEAAHAHSRTHRGGSFDTVSSYNSAGTRITTYPVNSSSANGSRASLYINL